MLEIKREYAKYTYKTFRVPDEIIEKLDKIAREKNSSVNKVVIQCLEYALDNIEK